MGAQTANTLQQLPSSLMGKTGQGQIPIYNAQIHYDSIVFYTYIYNYICILYTRQGAFWLDMLVPWRVDALWMQLIVVSVKQGGGKRTYEYVH